MRILAAHPGPEFSVADVHQGITTALAGLGVQIIDFNLHDRLAFYQNALETNEDKFEGSVSEQAAILASHSLDAAVYEWWPDVLLLTFGKFVAPFVYQLARQRGIKVVLYATESPYEDAIQLDLAQYCDLVLLNDPTNLDKFEAVTRSVYMPHAYDPALHRPGRVKDECRSEFCFVGSGYPARARFFEAVDWTGIDIALAGNWKNLDTDSPLRKFVAHDLEVCCDNSETVDLYRATKASANLYRNEGKSVPGWSVGPREIELAACQTFFLRDSRPEGDDLFPMLPTFDSPEDFGEKLRYFLAHDDARVKAAYLARAAIADRTFTQNATRLLELLT